jgi:hypothetical protein
MKVEHWWNDWKGERVVLEKILLIINPTWTGVGLNPEHRNKKPTFRADRE